ncbi:DUF7473 family protein [Halococcus saccharolyticus]|uniref:Uncharacterized protein n=1 Tax=Halococcus saccharolyticus DSM 5350 TaxID=1227455 RepID=M0MH48_9EURY|nr:hypothetical protein [Halococcus saccharolyticus]EMA43999.1 hypothetical protein C449_10743 [Halococcus saccharolyticus DSM 5350]
MIGAAVLQVSPTAGGPLAYLGSFVLFAVVYSVTAHIAARNVLGDVPLRRAGIVGVAIAVVVLLLQQYGAIAFVVALAVDFVVIRYVYRLRYRTTGLVTFVHLVVSILLTIATLSLVRLLGTAPT